MTNRHGNEYTIVEYNSCFDLTVEFKEFGYIKEHIRYEQFKSGSIKCPMDRTVLSIGYIGIGPYDPLENKNNNYDRWNNMLKRCYSKRYKNNKKSYNGCSVCDEWQNYQNFARWFDENYYQIEGCEMHIDKDILIKNNKVYSPDTCIIVPEFINSMFTNRKAERGALPLGVNWNEDHQKYQSACCDPLGKRHRLGYFDTPEKAFDAYKRKKEEVIKKVADKYKNQIPEKLYHALYSYKIEITD